MTSVSARSRCCQQETFGFWEGRICQPNSGCSCGQERMWVCDDEAWASGCRNCECQSLGAVRVAFGVAEATSLVLLAGSSLHCRASSASSRTNLFYPTASGLLASPRRRRHPCVPQERAGTFQRQLRSRSRMRSRPRFRMVINWLISR
jgi:hypothetical protein